MIPLAREAEPGAFDSRVRKRGLSAIDEMVGRPPRTLHAGPRRRQIASHEKDIPPEKFPSYWRDALPDLLRCYKRRCAFLALYLESATGSPSVDHMLPKSRRWDLVYEWSNYRLCAASINARKKDMTGLIDPFECQPGWFVLELVGFQVTRGPAAPIEHFAAIDATLALVNATDCCDIREEYVREYSDGHIDLDYLSRRAPFVAQELRRQGRLRPGDR